MQKSTHLSALLVALCTEQVSAGGGAPGNRSGAANYTTLAAHLSALRLSNSSHSSANSTTLGHNLSLQPATSGQALRRQQLQGLNKKTASVVYGKKEGPAERPSRLPLTCLHHRPHNSATTPATPHPTPKPPITTAALALAHTS